MSKISMTEGHLIVPDKIVVPFIEGDGVGAEITPCVQSIVDAAIAKSYRGIRSIHWHEVLAGEKAFKKTGNWLPTETMAAFREYLVGVKGPLTTPVGGGIRSLNVTLRQTLDLYACVRPVRYFRGVVSPLKHPQKVDMCIFRENTEDFYAGIEWAQGTPEAEKLYRFLIDELKMPASRVRFPETSSFGVKPISIEGTERLVRAAIRYAIDHHCPSVTIVHKGNIMKFTEGGFKNWGYALAAREFPDKTFCWPMYEQIKKDNGEEAAKTAYNEATASGKVVIKDCITDAFLQNTLLKPEDYSVIAAPNLNGDYISDQIAATVGGIGISPGANINYENGCAIFEATHGTAPDIAGKNIVNPSSLLLSCVMMLDYIGWNEASNKITSALEKAFSEGKATHDLSRFMSGATTLGTKEFSSFIYDLVQNG